MTEFHSPNTDTVVEWQRDQWYCASRVSVESILEQNPALQKTPDAILDLIYSEVLLREGLGEVPSESEYLLRFPQVADGIRRQFQVHRALTADITDEAVRGTGEYQATIDEAIRSAPPARRSADLPAEHLPNIVGFDIMGIAGRGGNGAVYRAMDTALKRIVAVKQLDKSWSSDSLRSRQLLREAEAAAALVHPNIVQVFQIGELAGSPFLVMEFVDGGSLAERLKLGQVTVNEAVDLCCQIADAVHYAHTQNIIHRDLKPGNILLDSRQQARVCDFGLARRLGTEETMHVTGDVVGTPAYMPPEQARGEHVDARADVYALGAILYEMLCGRPPFQAATPWEILHQVLTGDIIPLRHFNSRLPEDLITICEHCLEKDRSFRYSSAEEVLQELDRFRNGLPIMARPPGSLIRLTKWVRRNRLITAVLTVVVASLAMVATNAVLSQQRVSEALGETQVALQLAELQRDVTVKAINDLVYRVHDDLEKRQASVEARAEVLRSAIFGLQKIMHMTGDREDTRTTLATALNRYGYILTQQGKNEEAEKQYLHSIEVADTLQSDAGLGQRAQNYSNVAMYYVKAADFNAVEAWAQRTLVVAGEQLQRNPGNIELRTILVQAKTHLASAASVLKDPTTAFSIRQEARQACANLYADHPEQTNARDQLIDINLLLILDCLNLKRYSQAEVYVRECLQILEALDPETTEDMQIRRRYGSALQHAATVQFAFVNYDEAIETLHRTIDITTRMTEIEPDRPGFHLRLGAMHELLADCFLATHQLDLCHQHVLIHIAETRKGMELGGPTYAIQRLLIAKGLYQLGNLKLRMNDKTAAAKAWRDSAAEMLPIIELYNIRELQESIGYTAEVMAALAGLPHEAESSDVDAVRRAIDAWTAIRDGDASVFVQNETQLRADLHAAIRPEIRQLLTGQIAASYGLQYSMLLKSSTNNASELQEVETKCIEALQLLQSGPNADPLLPMRLPEYHDLRKNERFMQTFGVQ